MEMETLEVVMEMETMVTTMEILETAMEVEMLEVTIGQLEVGVTTIPDSVENKDNVMYFILFFRYKCKNIR